MAKSKKFSFHYIINGKRVTTKVPIYYYVWTLNGGCVKFGMHGTQAEWKAKLKDLKEKNSYVLLTLQEFVRPEYYEEED